MDVLKFIQAWYSENADLAFEKKQRIKVETLENPGWYIEIDLRNTYLDGVSFDMIEFDDDKNDWLQCFIRDNTFVGAGDANKLNHLLKAFHLFALSSEVLWANINDFRGFNETVKWLEEAWYLSNCDEDCDNEGGIDIVTIEYKGWSVKIDYEETTSEDFVFDGTEVKNSENDWYSCREEKKKFIGSGGRKNLTDILRVFQNFININLAGGKGGRGH